jgi:hypothetical protein
MHCAPAAGLPLNGAGSNERGDDAMKKSTRALTGLVLLDALILAGAAWMMMQVKSGAWNAPDPAATITEITRTAGGAIGIVSAVLLVAFEVQRRRGG